MREPVEDVMIFRISVAPVFKKDCQPQLKLNYSQKLALIPSASFIQSPDHVYMNNGGTKARK